MTDIVDRAKRALSDYGYVKAVGVSPCPDQAYRLVADLVAEVERLRAAIRPTITTTDELDALPVGAIVKAGNEPGGIFEKDRSNNWGYGSDEDGDLLLAESAANMESVIVPWTPEAAVIVPWTPEADQ